MADSSTQSLTMQADAASIMAAIADFEAYPEWTGAVKSVEVKDSGSGAAADRARRVKFRLDAGLISDTYELEYSWASDGLSVSWDLVSGQMQKSQHGSYVLQPLSNGRTSVTYSLTVQLTVPLIGVLRRKAERTIMDTALKELAKRVEPR